MSEQVAWGKGQECPPTWDYLVPLPTLKSLFQLIQHYREPQAGVIKEASAWPNSIPAETCLPPDHMLIP